MPEARDRKESERQFHNERYGSEHDSREHLNKWYKAVNGCTVAQNDMVVKYGKGANVLEYGCADGTISLVYDKVTPDAASFHGIDISDMAIAKARETAASLGLKNCQFSVMDAENMTFPENTFELVFGRGILHHLDLNKCFSEISRVLKKGGKGVFAEPLGHNPLINWYRDKTPHLRTPDEHPLLMSDFVLARKFFSEVDYKFYGLLTLAAVPFSGTLIGSGLMKFCEWIDSLVLRIPFIRRHAWVALIVVTK